MENTGTDPVTSLTFLVGVCSWRFNSGRFQSVAFVGRRGSIPSPSSPARAFELGRLPTLYGRHFSWLLRSFLLLALQALVVDNSVGGRALSGYSRRWRSAGFAGSCRVSSPTAGGAHWLYSATERRVGQSFLSPTSPPFFRLTPPVGTSPRVRLQSTCLVGLASGPGNLMGSNSRSLSSRLDALTLLLSVLRSSTAVSWSTPVYSTISWSPSPRVRSSLRLQSVLKLHNNELLSI